MEQASKRNFNNHIEKNQSHLIDMTVDLINNYITTQSILLNIDAPTPLNADDIHSLPSRRFRKVTKDIAEGCYFPLQRTIYLNQEHSSPLLSEYNTQLVTVYTLIHEGLHSASFLQLLPMNKSQSLLTYKRLGYRILSFNKKERKYFYFDGFNESVTNKLALECIELHKDELWYYYGQLTRKKDSDSIATELKKIAYTFNKQRHQAILDTILIRIAHDNNMSVECVWREFKKGYFTRDIQCLRMIEETFGKGSLRILSLLNYPTHQDNYSAEYFLDNAILKYFKFSNQQENA